MSAESISQYVKQKEYIITLYKLEDLDGFYNDMETPGGNLYIPDRAIECADRRPVSRSTHYMLTDWEAQALKDDTRVRSVELHPRYLGIKAGTYETQTSNDWNKSGSTSNVMKNWGLLRCYEGADRSGWGSNGTTNQTGTINLNATGRNVDVVVIDENGLVWNHPDYAVNSDGTGGTRTNQYNWFQHNLAVKGTAPGTYTYGTGTHSTHVAGTVAGNTQGWARDANIYNIYYLAGDDFDRNFPYVMDYVREFHRTKSINLSTGRKNPTITNNSWGMSIFPSEWSFSDITSVTYRGTTYTPSGATTYTGYSGVCTSNARLATLVEFENAGNRITTSGPYTPPSGAILTKPVTWGQTGQQATLTIFTVPDASYELTIQGPADIDLINNVAADAISGSMSISSAITIMQGATTIATYTDGPYSTTNGGTIETNIRPTRLNLPNTAVYTVTFETTLDTSGASSVTHAVAMGLTVVTETTPATANVSSLSTNLLGAASLASSTTPTVGDNDDGYWTLNLPFDITFLGTIYSTIYVGTNHYLTFGGGSANYQSLGPTNPNLPKIMWACADNSVQRIYYGVEGTAPNRTYRVRLEGSAAISGTIGSPTMVCEYTFYEDTPNQIDLQCGVNGRKVLGGGFTTEQLQGWGFVDGARIPKRVNALDSDIELAINEGIIYVGAGGNGYWKHDIPGGLDWNNTFQMSSRYPDSVLNPYYYMRGSSPTANDTTAHPDGNYDLPNICVGSIDVTMADYKAQYSDCGPGIDIFAPGTNIISTYPSGVSDSRGGGFLGKLSGTSMASPQVCGVLACALENNPHWKQEQAKAYITGVAKSNQITDTSGGPADYRDLQGAPDKYLFYRKDRADTGTMVPKLAQGARPTSGATWPRPRIYRFK
jgi:hypothetical protein